MEKKSYSLVAWTDKGQTRMIPSLVDELSIPYREKIDRIDEREYDNEVCRLLDKSRAWEDFARFFIRVGYTRQAYRCYYNAGCVCTCCSDEYWRQGDSCDFPTLPLLYRFMSMHKRCKEMAERHPLLRCEYDGSGLESSYNYLTRDEVRLRKEFDESYESMKAWRFGKL